jgi:hypothetical protein
MPGGTNANNRGIAARTMISDLGKSTQSIVWAISHGGGRMCNRGAYLKGRKA